MSSAKRGPKDPKSPATTQSSLSGPTDDQIHHARALMSELVQPSETSVKLSSAVVDIIAKFMSGEVDDFTTVTEATTRLFVAGQVLTHHLLELSAAISPMAKDRDTDPRARHIVQHTQAVYNVKRSAEKKIVDALVRLTSCPRYNKKAASPVIATILMGYQGVFPSTGRPKMPKASKNSNPTSTAGVYEALAAMDTLMEGLLTKCEEPLKVFQQSSSDASEAIRRFTSGGMDDPGSMFEAVKRCSSAQMKHDYVDHKYNALVMHLMAHRHPVFTRRFQNVATRNLGMFEAKCPAQTVFHKALVNLMSCPEVVLDEGTQQYVVGLESQIEETQKTAHDLHLMAASLAILNKK